MTRFAWNAWLASHHQEGNVECVGGLCGSTIPMRHEGCGGVVHADVFTDTEVRRVETCDRCHEEWVDGQAPVDRFVPVT